MGMLKVLVLLAFLADTPSAGTKEGLKALESFFLGCIGTHKKS
jgi:hypothetical protein